ncbi:hypothetical protein ACFY74_11775 [Streptomyces massasporeus]|uniref:hypothetical protein n=1 Tax=Streptomyces massasporeus TaxID=67324 RepID=UPI0036C35835
MNQPPHYPPPPPGKSRTNAVIIGTAAALIIAIVGTGVYVAQSRDDGSGAAPAPTVVASTPASPEAPPSVNVSPECRTWIKAELLDDSEEIDATPGYNACGDLSDDELQTAIDQVTEELSAEITPEP